MSSRTAPAAETADRQAIRALVMQGIAACRTPGLSFPAHFLKLAWESVAGGHAVLFLRDGAHCRDRRGQIDIAALGVFVDNALATSSRAGNTPGSRMGTVHLELQLTGEPVVGDLRAESRLLGRIEGTALQHSLPEATITAGGRAVCHARGEFVRLDAPSEITLAPLPWEHSAPPPAAPVNVGALKPLEQKILAACDAALLRSSSQTPFLQCFWSGLPRRTKQGAVNRVTVGPHMGNRVGHLQGGILLGIAAATACAAAPAAMLLSNLSAWYISPGRGDSLRVRSRIVHSGRTIAMIRTEVKTDAGKPVAEAMTLHAAPRKG